MNERWLAIGLRIVLLSGCSTYRSEWRSPRREAMTVYRDGKGADAETAAKRAFDVTGSAVGPEHPDVAESLENLTLIQRAKASRAGPTRCTAVPWPWRKGPTARIIPKWPDVWAIPLCYSVIRDDTAKPKSHSSGHRTSARCTGRVYEGRGALRAIPGNRGNDFWTGAPSHRDRFERAREECLVPGIHGRFVQKNQQGTGG